MNIGYILLYCQINDIQKYKKAFIYNISWCFLCVKLESLDKETEKRVYCISINSNQLFIIMTEEKKSESTRKIKRERSSAYPAISIEEAIDLSGKLINSYSKSPFSRQLAVQGIGYGTITGTSAPKIAALVHYGLLTRSSNTYKNSELASRILDLVSEEDKRKAILIAVIKPKLFASLINEYSGQAVPNLLKNILVSQYKIGRKVADKVAKNFKDSVEYAGLYVNGVISEIPGGLEESNILSSQDNIFESKPLVVSQQEPEGSVNTTNNEFSSVTLPSGVIIQYPEDLKYFFHTGEFTKQIKDLDTSIAIARKTEKDKINDEKQNNTTTEE